MNNGGLSGKPDEMLWGRGGGGTLIWNSIPSSGEK